MNNEKDTKKTLEILSNFVGQDNIVKFVQRVPNFNDEPKLSQVVSLYKGSENERAGACSSSLDIAALKAVGEGVERHCNYGFENNDLTAKLSVVKDKALDPRTLTPFSEKQMKDKNYRSFHINDNSVFGWVSGFCLTKRKNVYIPSQEVYLNYKFQKKEPIIRFPISTGAAGGTTLKSALVRGICEVIERDAVMVTYLDMLPIPRIDINSCPESIQDLNDKFEKYMLEIRIFDITTDISVPAVVTAIIDHGYNRVCPIAVGSKCGFNAEDVITGSIFEAQNGRLYTRELLLKGKKRPERIIEISEFEHRSMFWTNESLLKTLNFYIKGKKITFKKFDRFRSKKLSFEDKFNFLLSIIKKGGYDVYYKDITKPEIKKEGYHVVKSIVPGLHPLFFDELFPYNYSERLKIAPKNMGYKGKFTGQAINKTPHPFL